MYIQSTFQSFQVSAPHKVRVKICTLGYRATCLPSHVYPYCDPDFLHPRLLFTRPQHDCRPLSLETSDTSFHTPLILMHWKWRQHVTPKRCCLSNNRHV